MQPSITVCIPGSGFSGKWLAAWNGLYSRLLKDYDYRVTVVQGEGNNIYDVRGDCIRKLAEVAADHPPEHVLWIDSDNIVSYEGFVQLHYALTQVPEASAVGGWYLFTAPDSEQPMVAAGSGDERPSVANIKAAIDAGAHLMEVEYIGFGFLLMKFRLLEELGLRAFTPILRDDGDCETDDVSFCLRATRLNHKFFLHAGVHAPHLKLLPIPVSMRTQGQELRKAEAPKPNIERDNLRGIQRIEGSEWWTPANDESLPTLLAEQRESIYAYGNFGVRLGDVVIDCGANIGVFAKQTAAIAALVVAIEADPVTAAALGRNLEPEKDSGKAVVVPLALWDVDGVMLPFSRQERFWSANSAVILRGEGETEVKAITIDSLVKELRDRPDVRLNRIDFIKMDIEGAEKRALEGACETISQFHPRLAIACEHFVDDEIEITRFISKWPNYRAERRGDVLFFEPIQLEKERNEHATPIEQFAS